jgi:D-alanyl-D-alanine carboxypeptidase
MNREGTLGGLEFAVSWLEPFLADRGRRESRERSLAWLGGDAMTAVRIGAVSYLNARPLVHGLQSNAEYSLCFDTPGVLSEKLRLGEIDVGLIPIVEFLRGVGESILPGICIASDGPVHTVKLYSKVTVPVDPSPYTVEQVLRTVKKILREADGTTLTVTSGTKELSSDSGAVDPDVPWNIGSLTKTFVGVVVLQLADEGAIDLDAPIGPYFPERPALAPITARQLLQHTSGLNEYWPSAPVLQDAGREWTPLEEIDVAEAAGRFDAPGATYHYSNTNYVILGELISRVTSETWNDSVRERITEPLGMRSTGLVGSDQAPGFVVADTGLVPFDPATVHPSVGGAAGGLQSTASDLLVFAEALADGRLVSSRMRAEMETFTPGEDYSAYGVVHGYGLGLETYSTDKVTVYGHMGTGAAQGSFAGFDPESGTLVVTLMNSDPYAAR